MVYVLLPPHLGYSRMSRQRSRNASATCPRSPRERPITAGDNEASLGRVWDHKKLLERGFLLCTASIYHCNNVIVDADICCARILRARALLWARYRPFRYVPRLQLVTMRRLQDAFGTIKSFPRSVFCSGQTVYIIYTGYRPRGSF